MDTRKPYPSDLTNTGWSQVCRFVAAPKPGVRLPQQPDVAGLYAILPHRPELRFRNLLVAGPG